MLRTQLQQTVMYARVEKKKNIFRTKCTHLQGDAHLQGKPRSLLQVRKISDHLLQASRGVDIRRKHLQDATSSPAGSTLALVCHPRVALYQTQLNGIKQKFTLGKWSFQTTNNNKLIQNEVSSWTPLPGMMQTGFQYQLSCQHSWDLSCQQLSWRFRSKWENMGVSINRSSWTDKKENVFLGFRHFWLFLKFSLYCLVVLFASTCPLSTRGPLFLHCIMQN